MDVKKTGTLLDEMPVPAAPLVEPNELEKTVEFEIGAGIEEEEEEDAPISKKDNAIKTLVNF